MLRGSIVWGFKQSEVRHSKSVLVINMAPPLIPTPQPERGANEAICPHIRPLNTSVLPNATSWKLSNRLISTRKIDYSALLWLFHLSCHFSVDESADRLGDVKGTRVREIGRLKIRSGWTKMKAMLSGRSPKSLDRVTKVSQPREWSSCGALLLLATWKMAKVLLIRKLRVKLLMP